MEWTELLFRIGLPVINALIASVIIPCFIKKIATLKDRSLYNFVKKAVLAAEQLYGGKSGRTKKWYALDRTKKRYGSVKDSIVETYIEVAVKEIKEEDREYKTQNDYQKQNAIEVKEERDKIFNPGDQPKRGKIS